MCRQLAYESYGVGEQEGEIVDGHLPHCGVERGEKLVFGEDVALAQEVHDRRFSYVGIAYECHARHVAAVLALYALLLVDVLQFLLESGDFVEDYSAVGFYLGLTRAAHADTASLTFEVGPHSGKAREQILVLRQLHLGAGRGRLCSFCENVEDEARAVEDLYLEFLLDVEHLLGREVVVEDDEAYLVVFHILAYLVELAGAHVCAGIGIVEFLDETLLRLRAGGLGEEFELVEIFVDFSFALLLGDEADEHRPFVFFFIYYVVFYHEVVFLFLSF